MSLFKPFLAVIMLVVLSACATSGVSDYAQSEVNKVSVTGNENRNEQLFRQEIQNLIKASDDQRYDLSFEITPNRGDDSIRMTVNYSVYDQKAGKVIITKSASSSVSIGAVSSEFSEEQAFVYAEERLSKLLAQKVYQRLLIHFSATESKS